MSRKPGLGCNGDRAAGNEMWGAETQWTLLHGSVAKNLKISKLKRTRTSLPGKDAEHAPFLHDHTSDASIAYTIFSAQNFLQHYHAVTFLRMALRHATRTLFSSQGTADQFFSRPEKTEGRGLKPQTPNHGMNPRGLRRAEALFCQDSFWAHIR